MSRVLTNEQNYYDIADTIRQMKNVNTTYKPRQMASALKDIYSNEVEGTLPLSFEANGNFLLDYKIDGAIGGVGDRTNNLFDKKNTEIIHAYFTPENLWQVNEDSSSIIIKVRPNTQYTLSIGTAISIFRIYKTSLENPEPGKGNVFTPIIRSSNIKTYTFTTDNDTTYIIFQGTNADTEMWINSLILNIGSTSLPSYEPYGYKVPVVVNGKNLFDENSELNTNSTMDLTTGTFPGSTGDNKRTFFFKAKPNTTYTFSCDTIGDRLVICEYNRIINPSDYSTSHKITPNIKTFSQASGISEYSFTTSSTTKMVGIYYSLNTLPTSIQIEIGNIATDYEPYIEETTNIYLDNPILENESISLSDTNTNIPTIEGTNVLSIDTTVQPSNVYVQAPKDSIEATMIANALEEI